MPKILIVGGGYAGFYTAWKLEKWLRPGEAEVTIVDPLPVHDLPAVPSRGRRRLDRAASLGRLAASSPQEDQRHHREGHPHRPRRRRRRRSRPRSASRGSSTTTSSWSPAAPSRARSRSRASPTNAIGLKNDRRGRRHPRPRAHQLRQGVQPAGRSRARPPAHLRRRRRRLRGHRGVRRAALLRERRCSSTTRSSSFDDTHFHLIEAMGRIMPEVSLQDEPLGHQEPRPARRRDPPRHAAHERGRRQHRAVDRRDLRVRPHRLDRRRHGQPGHRALDRPPGRGARPHADARRPARRRRRRLGAPTPGPPATSPPCPTSRAAASAATACRTPSTPCARASSSRRTSWRCCAARSPKEYFHKNLGAVAGLGVGSGVFQSGKHRDQGPHRLVHAPRLPRPRHAQLGAQDPRVLGLVEQLLARPRHRLARGRAAAARAVRGVRRPPEGRRPTPHRSRPAAAASARAKKAEPKAKAALEPKAAEATETKSAGSAAAKVVAAEPVAAK